MKRSILCVFILLFLVSFASATAAIQAKSSQASYEQNTTSRSHSAQPTGDEVFKANCSRCHTPPMTISPRITGTVIMHMRTRARLSRQDEQLLLKYMAP